MSYGDGDPSIPEGAREAHAAAVARGEGGYFDPATGLFVMTAPTLAAQGRCCGRGCRHCPFSAEDQRAAGRLRVRPAESKSDPRCLDP